MRARRGPLPPKAGQKGKDAIWAATPDEFVNRMLAMARTTADDHVIDLGAGDGNFAIAAAKRFGARSLGIEYNPELVKLAQCMVRGSGAEGRARVVEGDVFKEDFSKADVLTIFLLPHLNQCLRHRILAMRPGVRVVSYLFSMGDWEPNDLTAMELDVAVPVDRAGAGRRPLGVPPAGARRHELHRRHHPDLPEDRRRGHHRRPALPAPRRHALRRPGPVRVPGRHGRPPGLFRPAGTEGHHRRPARGGRGIDRAHGGAAGRAAPRPWAEMDPKCGKFYGK